MRTVIAGLDPVIHFQKTSFALLLALSLTCTDAHALTGADPDAGTLQRYTVVVAGTKGRCTGVVVAQNIVLTAAHCLEAGTLRITTNIRSIVLSNVMQAIPHPNYKSSERGSPDLAILRLASPLPGGFSPVHLEPRWVSEGTDLVVAGYGKSADNDKGQTLVLRTVLQHVEGRNSAYLTLKGVGDSAAGAAPGDSGGPVFSYRGMYALVAIMIGHAGRSTIAIAIAPNYAWIRETMEQVGGV